QPEDWEAHRAGVLQSLAPVGTLEEALAGRVALCLWRLDRVARYETAVTAVRLEEACEEIRSAESPSGPFGGERYAAGARRQKAGEALEKKRETVALWEGSAKLMEQLLRPPDPAKVTADDVYGVFQDLYGEAAEIGNCPDPDDSAFLTALG